MPSYNNQYRVHIDGIEPDLGGWFNPPEMGKGRKIKEISVDATKKVRYEVVGPSQPHSFTLNRHYSKGEPQLAEWYDSGEPGKGDGATPRRDGRVEFIGEGGVVTRIVRWSRGLPVKFTGYQTVEEGGTLVESIIIQAEDLNFEEV
jgi:hypothetical protein